jgi:hypothetical protein
MPKTDSACKTCGRTREKTRLEKCIICLEPYCRACAFRRHGKPFCGRECADVFFFGDPDED